MNNIPEITKIEKKLFKDDELNKTLDVFSIFYKSDNIIVQGYVLKKKILSKKVPVIIVIKKQCLARYLYVRNYKEKNLYI